MSLGPGTTKSQVATAIAREGGMGFLFIEATAENVERLSARGSSLAYAAANAALGNLTRSLARVLAPEAGATSDRIQ